MPSKSGSNIRAGGAFVEFFCKDGNFEAGLRKVGKTLKTFGASAAMSGAAISGVGLSALAPIITGVRTFATFEQAMSNVRARTGATADEMSKLDQLANQLGMTTKFSATEAANAMEVFAKAGFDVGKIMQATGDTLNLAATSGVSIAEAADIATNILGGFRLEATEMNRVVDVLSLASNSAKVSVSELGESLKIVGAKGAASGYAVEELTAVMQELGDSGIRGEQAGVAVRGMLLALTSATGPAREALDAIGFSHKDAAGNVLSLTEMIGQLQRAFERMPSGDRAEAMGRIFTNAQTSGAETLIMSGVDSIRARTQALQEAAGTAARISAVQKDNILGDEEIVSSAMEGMFITLGKIFGGSYRVSLGIVNAVIQKTTEWIDKNRSLIVVYGTVAVGTVLIGTALIGLGISVGILGFAVSGLATLWGLFAGVMAAVASPLGLTVIALSGLAYWSGAGGRALSWLKEQFGPLAQIASETFEAIRTALNNGNLTAAANVIWAGLNLAWLQGTASLRSIWRGFSGEAVESWRGVQDIIAKLWVKLVSVIEKQIFKMQALMNRVKVQWKQLTGDLTPAEAANQRAGLRMRIGIQGRQADAREKRDADMINIDAEERRKQAREDATQAEIDSAKALAEARAAFEAAKAEAMKPVAGPVAEAARKKGITGQGDGTLGGGLVAVDSKMKADNPGVTFAAIASQMFGNSGDIPKQQLAFLKIQVDVLKKIEVRLNRKDDSNPGVMWS